MAGALRIWPTAVFRVGFQKLVVQIYSSATYLTKCHLPCLAAFPLWDWIGRGIVRKNGTTYNSAHS